MSRRLVLAGALVVTACAPQHHHGPVINLIAEQDPATTTTTTVASTTTTLPAQTLRSTQRRGSRTAARSRTGNHLQAIAPTGNGAGSTYLSATAYCETGRTANGQHPYVGSAAGNRWPFGTRLHVVELGRDVVINDRIGHGSDLDIAFPGDCAAARRFGRRTVTVVAA